MAHATKRKNICTAKVSDDFQGFFPLYTPPPPLPFATFRPSWFFWSHHQRAQGDCRFGKSRHKTQIHLLVVSKVFTRWLQGGVGRGREGSVVLAMALWWQNSQVDCWSVNSFAGIETKNWATSHCTALHSSTQLYTALPSTARHCTTLDSTQHWPTRWGINLKLRAAANMPHTHTSAHCFMQGGVHKREGEERRERERGSKCLNFVASSLMKFDAWLAPHFIHVLELCFLWLTHTNTLTHSPFQY